MNAKQPMGSSPVLNPTPADPVLDELGRILIACLRLDHVSATVTGHLLDALRLRALDAGWFNHHPARSGQALQPWQKELALEMLLAPTSAAATIRAIASACGLSTPQFSRAFKATFGTPPLKWRLTARVDRAKTMMLETTRSLTDIALECGFAEQAHFNHIFLKRVGTPPNAWRRQNTDTAGAGRSHRFGEP